MFIFFVVNDSTTGYAANTVTITFSTDAAIAGSDDLSGTLRAHLNNFSLYNVNVRSPLDSLLTMRVKSVHANFLIACSRFGLTSTGHQFLRTSSSSYRPLRFWLATWVLRMSDYWSPGYCLDGSWNSILWKVLHRGRNW